jgi:hypothetical protein
VMDGLNDCLMIAMHRFESRISFLINDQIFILDCVT